jgi:hypothetical protein
MSMIENLVRGFERANVPLKVTDAPFVRGVDSDRIVQMDVRREGKAENVFLYPGLHNELVVTGTDAAERQLVLRVREAARKFTEQRWDKKQRIFRTVERRTTPALRRFLVGMDEAHLFVAQLTTKAETVEQAHEGLRPAVLRERPEKFRQGEWFFVPITPDEREQIGKTSYRFFERNARIGRHLSRRGRSHNAEQLVQLRQGAGPAEFVRGRVRHPDHATLELETWMRVFMNTEDRSVGASWVD